MRRSVSNFSLLLMVLGLLGCSSNSAPKDRIPMVQLSHISAEDAPVVTTVRIYETTIEIAALRGFTKSRKNKDSKSLDSLRELLALPGLTEISTEDGLGSHHFEEFWLESGNWVVGFRRDDPPEGLRTVLAEIDRLVFKYFNKSFTEFN